MGKISEYDKVNKLSASDTFILEGADGTKGITTNNLVYAALDASIPVEMRRNTFRGKNLGSVYTDAQKSEVRAGTFKDLFIGDYWNIGGFVWRIVDINYWLNTGDTACTKPHLVIMPDSILYTTQMNDTDTTKGGYVGSKMRTENLENAKTIVNSAFGVNDILKHREMLVNAVENGVSSGIAWYSSNLELPNEIMMYGGYAFTQIEGGSSKAHTINKTQLALMKIYHKYIQTSKYEDYWLRDVVSESLFAAVNAFGYLDRRSPSVLIGVRPVFGLIG